MADIQKIGMLAGDGGLPLEIIKKCRGKGIEIYVACLVPFASEENYGSVPHVMARMGEVGKMMKFFKAHGVVDIVLAGGIKRPGLKELIPDFEAVKMLAKIALTKQSDDGLLRGVIREIELRGFHIVGIEQVMPELLFHQGVYGRVKPNADDMDDIRRGIEIAKALGAVDVGQAVVIQEGRVLAVEAVEGTDMMLARAETLKKPGNPPIMVKIMKSGQDRRVDVPTIGMHTIEQLKKYGMGGVAVEAGGILIVEREAVIAAADAAKIFIVGIEIEGGNPVVSKKTVNS